MTDKNDEIKRALTAVLTEESYVEEELQRGKPMSEKKTKNLGTAVVTENPLDGEQLLIENLGLKEYHHMTLIPNQQIFTTSARWESNNNIISPELCTTINNTIDSSNY